MTPSPSPLFHQVDFYIGPLFIVLRTRLGLSRQRKRAEGGGAGLNGVSAEPRQTLTTGEGVDTVKGDYGGSTPTPAR